MGIKRIIVGSVIFIIGIIAWLRIWYGENALLPMNPTNATEMAKAYANSFDPNVIPSIFVVAVIIAIGSVILASGIRSSFSQN